MEASAVTNAHYDALSPEEQGYVAYWQGAWNRAMPRTNPYRRHSEAYLLWEQGKYRAILAAQDSEE